LSLRPWRWRRYAPRNFELLPKYTALCFRRLYPSIYLLFMCTISKLDILITWQSSQSTVWKVFIQPVSDFRFCLTYASSSITKLYTELKVRWQYECSVLSILLGKLGWKRSHYPWTIKLCQVITWRHAVKWITKMIYTSCCFILSARSYNHL
jgi:hypothetical protein